MIEHFRQYVHDIWIKDTEINELYLNLLIRSLALSMLGIFVPIYLLTLGFNMVEISLYMITNFFIMIVASFFSVYLMKTIGVKHTILMSVPFVISDVMLLYFLSRYEISIFAIAIVGGMGQAFYWMGLHTNFIKNSGKHGVTKKTGLYFVLPKVSALIGPFVGGALITLYGFPPLIAISAILLLLSAIPLLRTGDFRGRSDFDISNLFSAERVYFLGFVGEGVRNIFEYFFWPIAIFMVAKSSLEVGLVGSVMQIGTMFLPFLIAKLRHKIDLKIFIRAGAVFYAILIFYLQTLSDPKTMIILSSLMGLLTIMISMPFYTMSVKHSRSFEPSEWVLYREIGVNLGRILVIAIGLLSMKLIFSSVGILSLVYLFI